ncbi:MAG: hypothetical protein NTY37_13450 [Methanothrix sp.]|nr:hypothetical protein [Methanothrix sp.]
MVILILTIFGLITFAPSSAQDVAPGLPLSGEMIMATTEIPPSMEISVEEIGDSIWKLFPSTENKKEILISVKADNSWQLITTDENPLTKGQMTEWTGSGYTSKHLISSLKVESVALPNRERIPARTGIATASKFQDQKISLIQEVSLNDEPLEPGHIYRIELTVTLSAE